jgi:hypothetical protein
MSENMMRTSDAVVFIGGQFGKNLACLSTKHNEALPLARCASATAKFIFAGRTKRLDFSQRTADVAKWQTQRT